jgi:hypothetical protein
MSSDFEKTFDKKLNNLEDSILETTPSKKIAFKLGIIAIINAVLLVIIKPVYIVKLDKDENNKKVIKLNIPYYILAVLLLTIIIYFGSNLYNKYKK